MSSSKNEPPSAVEFRQWLAKRGGGLHPNVRFAEVASGVSLIAEDAIESDSTIVTCPSALVITEHSAKKSVLSVLDGFDASATWSGRQWICTYICLHWIIPNQDARESVDLVHRPYLNTLPSRSQLRTSLHFTEAELELFKGTNLYKSTLDRKTEWQSEWSQCQAAISSVNQEWGDKYSWDIYLAAASHLSSRSFPSTLLNQTSSSAGSPSADPILLPGLDALNHARGNPVSWVASYANNMDAKAADVPNISLMVRQRTEAGQEVFNNYGPKPNSELILGYGFSLPNNPDDTIVLKIGGINGKQWEVGRNLGGVDGLWNEIVQSVANNAGSLTYEDDLDAAGALMEMVDGLLSKFSSVVTKEGVRPEVSLMFKHYIEGQRDILHSITRFAQEKERLAVETAREKGVELVITD